MSRSLWRNPDMSKGDGLPGRLGLALLIALAALFVVGGLPAAAQTDGEVLVLEIEGPVTPAMASYFERGIAAAEERDAAAMLIVLNTPGGAVDTTQEIIRSFRNAEVPVIVYVSPAGAQAASAGSLITLAAHAAGMAPQTVIGAASPVGGEGEDIGETLYRKVVEDLKATMRTLAERRGDDAVTLAEEMIEDARAVNSSEALQAGLIDAVAEDEADLLVELDGLKVFVDGRTQTLHTAGALQISFSMNVIERVLHSLSNPLLVSILLSLGVPAILIELHSPGGWVAGFVGVLCLGLAFYGLGQLPVNWLGLGLIALSFGLFLLEVKAGGIGAAALAGAGSMLAGLLLLFNSPGTPDFARISIPSALALTISTSGFFLFIVTMVVRAQRRKPRTGKEGLIGRTGRVRKTFVPAPSGPLAFTGSILVRGEIWRAQADEAIQTDEEVVVTDMKGFTLYVARAHEA